MNPKFLLNPSSKTFTIDPRISIARNLENGTFKFVDVFRGFEHVKTVRKTFGSRTQEVLKDLSVEVFGRPGYMGVSDEDGHIFASGHYLKEGETWCIYLDVVHELVHVRQFGEGKELFDQQYGYVDRPTEIEAYSMTVEEARLIGLTEEQILEYLEVPWIGRKELLRLAKSCGVKLNGEGRKSSSKL